MLESLVKKYERIQEMRRSDEGLYTVLWIDKFDGSDGVQGKYETKEEALEVARKLTNEAKKYCGGDDGGFGVATVYYAYDSKGKYLGGDTWKGE